ncbi:MAG TPA: poly-beta-1,6 N-acetyl-D-glucosamine export porin PgaA, partial [Desulfuromonadales bacterium]|nr:poly-beta-1,6 N-acetyl-D-glucosamine export porin PgaA [Desulfuromonadales bacterium]
MVFFFLGTGSIYGQNLSEEKHDRAIERARQGHTEEAVKTLRTLHRSNPKDKDVVYDLLAVLSWADRNAEALELADKIDPREAPLYVLKELAASYRHQQLYTEAERVYRLALRRFPGHLDLRAGLLLTLSDAGRPERALKRLGPAGNPADTAPTLLFARGYALEKNGQRFDALFAYRALLKRHPADPDARRRLILVLADLGAPFLAEEMADGVPGFLHAEEQERLRADQAALMIRWQRLGDRYPDISDRLETLLNSETEAVRHRALADLVVFHHDRGNLKEALDHFRQLEQQMDEPPLHALQAGADTLAALDCPEEAELLYRRILAKRPDDFYSRLGLFYALTDQGDFNRALEWIDRVLSEEPPYLPDGEPNPMRLQARIAAGLGRLFADDAPAAESRFSLLVRQAPGNADLWRELGSAESARGWPRRAQRTYRSGLSLEPLHRGLNIGLADTFISLGEFSRAEEIVTRLCLNEHQDQAVQRLARRWQLHRMRELYVEVSGGQSSGTEFGSREINMAATVMSRPIHDHFRTFFGYSRSKADFPEGEEVLHRYRAGARYRARNITAEAEVNFNADGSSDPGLSVGATWEPNDHWAFPGKAEIYSPDTPLRAIKNGVHADGISMGIRWRSSERRSWRLSLQRLEFTDGNQRHSAYTVLRQRLLTRPGLFLDGGLEAYASDNSRHEVAYFSPREDFSTGVTLSLFHQVFRRGD